DGIIDAKCVNRTPYAVPPFCCKTTGNMCIAASDRDACVTAGGQVMEDKTCGVSNTCDPLPGTHPIEWWQTCGAFFSGVCDAGASVSTVPEIESCINRQAGLTIDRLMCLEFRANGGADWPCPSSPSAAFVD